MTVLRHGQSVDGLHQTARICAGFEAAYRRAAGMTLATVRQPLDAPADGPDGEWAEADQEHRGPDQ